MNDSRVAHRVALGDGEKGAGSEPLELRLTVECVGQIQTIRKFAQQSSISGGVQRVRRQCREPARQVVAGGGGERDLEVGQFIRCCHIDPPQLPRRFWLALERGKAKRSGLQRGDRSARSGVVGSWRSATPGLLEFGPGENQQRLWLAPECRARQPSSGLESFEGVGRGASANRDEQGLRACAHSQLQAVPRLALLEAIQIAQRASKGHGVPLGRRGAGRHEYDGTCVAGQPRGGNRDTDMTYRDHQ